MLCASKLRSNLIFAEFVTWVCNGVHEGPYLEVFGHVAFILLLYKFVAIDIFMKLRKATQEAESGLFSELLAQLGRDAPDTEPSDTVPLSENELWWTRHFQWLKDCGYLLRPRYAPDWVPSWRGTKKGRYSCEDSVTAMVGNILCQLFLAHLGSFPQDYSMVRASQMELRLPSRL